MALKGQSLGESLEWRGKLLAKLWEGERENQEFARRLTFPSSEPLSTQAKTPKNEKGDHTGDGLILHVHLITRRNTLHRNEDISRLW